MTEELTTSARVRELTTQQIRVCRHLANGYTAAQTAQAMGLSVDTTKEHLKRARTTLTRAGYDVTNMIRLRRALRAIGVLDGIELI